MPDIPRRRNPVARSPLLRKGGVHEKNTSAKRQQQKLNDNRLLDDWREELEFEREMKSIIDLLQVDDVCFKEKYVEYELSTDLSRT